MFTVEKSDRTLNFEKERSISEIGKLLRAAAEPGYIDSLLFYVRRRLENETGNVRGKGNDSD